LFLSTVYVNGALQIIIIIIFIMYKAGLNQQYFFLLFFVCYISLLKISMSA